MLFFLVYFSSFAAILLGRGSWFVYLNYALVVVLVSVFLCYSLVVTWVGKWSVIVAFPGHSYLFFHI